MSGFNIDEYVDVAQRIHDFYERFPEGRLVTVDWEVKPDLDGKTFVWVHAKAFRTPDDPLPGDGLAWEPVPGPTQFTRDSELMNAQTAAWGRAIVALGFDTKKIASKQEVQARNGQQPVSTDVQGGGQTGGAASAYSGTPADFIVNFGKKHKGKKVADVPREYWEWCFAEGAKLPDDLRAAVELHLGLTAQPVGAPDDLDIPF